MTKGNSVKRLIVILPFLYSFSPYFCNPDNIRFFETDLKNRQNYCYNTNIINKLNRHV